jgi:hypothetical protein
MDLALPLVVVAPVAHVHVSLLGFDPARRHDPIHRASYTFRREGENLWVTTWLEDGGHLPEHFHPIQEERWESIDGTVRLKLAGEAAQADPDGRPGVEDRAVGVAAGFRGGLLDDVTMRLAEVVQGVPRFFLALMVLAGLFARSLMNVNDVALGFEPHGIASFEVNPGLNGYDPDAARTILESIRDELASIPGVSDVSAAVVAILRWNSRGTGVSIEGVELGPEADVAARTNAVGPDYFGTLGIRLLAGREFTETDDRNAPKVAIVNRAFARKFGLRDSEVTGRRMAIGGDRVLIAFNVTS